MSDSPSPVGALTVILNQRSATAPYHRATVEIDGDEHPGKAIGFDSSGVLVPIPVGGSSLATIAALKARSVTGLPTGTAIGVLGYYVPGDGGGGQFCYDAASAAADNGGTVIAPTSGSGRWLRILDNPGEVSVLMFGAKADYPITDNSPAFSAALAADGVVIVIVTFGTFKLVTGITVGLNKTLRGFGCNNSDATSKIAFPSGSGPAAGITLTDCGALQGLVIAGPDNGNAISLSDVANEWVIRDCRVSSALVGLSLTNCSCGVIQDSHFRQCSEAGVKIFGDSANQIAFHGGQISQNAKGVTINAGAGGCGVISFNEVTFQSNALVGLESIGGPVSTLGIYQCYWEYNGPSPWNPSRHINVINVTGLVLASNAFEDAGAVIVGAGCSSVVDLGGTPANAATYTVQPALRVDPTGITSGPATVNGASAVNGKLSVAANGVSAGQATFHSTSASGGFIQLTDAHATVPSSFLLGTGGPLGAAPGEVFFYNATAGSRYLFSNATDGTLAAISPTGLYIAAGTEASSGVGSVLTYGGIYAAKKIVSSGNFEALDVGEGFILKSPDGTRYRIQVANGGALSTTPA